MTNDKLLLDHSAQQLDNLSPDIIWKGTKRLDLTQDKEERQTITNNIDRVVSSSQKLHIDPKVTIYWSKSEFVVKSIPEEVDGYGRQAPILSYGNFMDKKTSEDKRSQWIEEVKNQIVNFAECIPMTLTDLTQNLIKESLKQAIEKNSQCWARRFFANFMNH